MPPKTVMQGDVVDKENVPPGAAPDHIGTDTALTVDANKQQSGRDSSSETKYNCDAIRGKIKAYLEDTNTDASDFQKQLQVQARSYQSFMRQDGPHAGVHNPTYKVAHEFFVKRDSEGNRTASFATKAPAATSTTSKVKPQTKSADKGEGKKNDDKADVPSFDDLPRLDGEGIDSVPVWDTCNDVRNKIKNHLDRNKFSNAAFCREVSKCLSRGSVSGTALKGFLDKNGKRNPNAGNTSNAFYASYVYFEKIRLHKGEKKSKKREEMEVAWAEEGGVERECDLAHTYFTVGPGESMSIDKYGQVNFH